MAKGQKISNKDGDSGSRSRKSTGDSGSRSRKSTGRESEITMPNKPEHEEVSNNNLEQLETQSVAESDSGRLCNDILAAVTAPEVKETVNNEPSLSDIIVAQYEGGRSNNGQFEGEGEAWFIGGNRYKGCFAEGVMHGKGKYSWEDGTQYEGDMNNNQISGYGRYEWTDKSYYEGEVLNGLRHGVGVFKSPKHNVSYSGQWYLGKRHGRGIMHYSEHSWYEGEWVNNSRHGWGVRRYHTGNVYEGQWVNDNRHGEGTMRWLTSDESFAGMWENGVQHGYGTHTWYLNRVPGSQYPLRNEYVGDFINGLRHGHGKFFFASGAVYNGEWENNKKHGWGKFIFKNGRVFEGQFENDHMVDHPTFHLDGNENPDITHIRTRTPVGWEEAVDDMSKDGSGNMLGPSLTLDIDSILDNFNEAERERELKQVTFLMLRNVSVLRRVYSFYSALGHDRSPDNTFVMTRFQLWRFLKDCKIHHHQQSLSAMDRDIARCHAASDIHNPMEKLLLREFLTSCVALSYSIYKNEEMSNTTKKTTVLSRCLQRLIDEHILKHSCRVGGHFLSEPRRAVNALAYMDRSWHIYQRVCTPRATPPYEPTLCMRQFLFLLKDLKIIGPLLTTRTVLNILSSDDPSVSDGESCNLEVEMTFLEFFEALIGIALKYISAESMKPPIIHEPSAEKLSRPASSATPHSITEAGQTTTNHAISTETLSQADDDKNDSHIQTSKHSMVSLPGGGGGTSTGGFLQTLSQMSVQDEPGLITEENQSNPPQEEPIPHPESENPHEDEFNVWCSKLNKFFTLHLFPSWNHFEELKSEAAKYKAEMEEQVRVKSIEAEAIRRRHLTSQEPPEEPEPVPETPMNVTKECSSVNMDNPQFSVHHQLPEVLEVPPARAASSNASVPSSAKSGKLKRKK